MPAQPRREDIKVRVIGVIARISGFPAAGINEAQRLEDDLGLGEAMRGGLAPGFTDIVRGYDVHGAVAASACRKLELVKDAIDLVFKKVSGK